MVTGKDPYQLSSPEVASWNDNGYLIIRGLFSEQTISSINQLTEHVWDNRDRENNPLVSDIYIGTDKERRVFFKNAPDEARSCPYKLNDLFLEKEEIRQFCLNPDLSSVLNNILGGAPVIWNTLNFEFGSQQEDHVDTLYMPSRVPNMMVASWIALEDATLENGPLRYYPGSHKIPAYRFSHGGITAVEAEMDAYQNYQQEEIEKRGIEPIHN